MPDSPAARVVPVEILGQRYPIRSTLDDRYIQELAAYVDGKMRAAADSAPNADSVRLAILTALNIADEYFRCRTSERAAEEGTLRIRRIEQIIDDALTTPPSP